MAVIRKELADQEPALDGFLHHHSLMRLRIGPDSVDRLLRLLHALITELERRGHRARCDYVRRPHVSMTLPPAFGLVVHGQPIGLEVKERGRLPPGASSGTRSYVPTGMMTLSFSPEWGTLQLQDKDTVKLEDLVGTLPDDLEQLALKTQERKKRAAAEAEERARQEAARREEERRIRELDSMLAAWRRTGDILAMTAEIRRMFASACVPINARPALQEFVQWAEVHAERTDPLTQIGSVIVGKT